MWFMRPNVEELATKRDVRGLIKALGYKKDSGVRRSAAVALGQIKDAWAVEPLIAALTYSNPKNSEVRQAAAEALVQIGDARAVEPLIATLKDWSPDVRKAAIEALGQIKNTRAIEPLIAALKHEDRSGMRRAAAEALGQVKDARAAESLIVALQDGAHEVSIAAAEALGRIGAPAVEPLVAALKDGDSAMRKTAVEALIKIGAAPAVEPLIAVLKDGNRDMRNSAASALGMIGDARAVEPLIAALKDKDSAVRSLATRALGQIGNTRAVEPLIAALKDDLLCFNAICSLGQIGDDRAVSPLIDILRDRKYVNTLYQQKAVEALIMIGTPAVEPLISALKDGPWYVRHTAAEALDKLGWQPDRDELGAIYWLARGRLDKCVQIGAPAVEPLISELNRSNFDSEASEAIAKTLGQIGDARAVDPLISALKPWCRGAAMALDRLGWQPDRDELGATYWIAMDQWDKCFETGAPAVKPLISMINILSSGNNDARRRAAQVLVRLYREGRLDESSKSRILSVQNIITRPHYDSPGVCTFPHNDNLGIGVEF